MQFAELTAGRVLTSASRSVTEREIVDFATQYDPQWFHTDPVRAQAGYWQGLIASGWMSCSIAMQLAVAVVLRDSESIGSPGLESLKWVKPLRPGDQVTLRMEVIESRISRSGKMGILRWRWLLVTHRDDVVLDLIATSLFDLAVGRWQSPPPHGKPSEPGPRQ